MVYLDTSALVKLAVKERETTALRRYIVQLDPETLVTSALTRAELLRAAYRLDSEVALLKSREILRGVSEMTLTQSLLDRAGVIEPPILRTLDAIHLVTALELGRDLRAFVAYDARLLSAARHAGLPTLSPA